MDDLITDKTKIWGQIYIITNTITTQQYVGQTVSHRKNKNKFRPFGIEGRFKDHVSEAMCNTKKKQCWYLNNAIRKYGKDIWTVKLIQDCSINELDKLEKKYIKDYNTVFPNGYNLTLGGKTTHTLEHEFTEETNKPSIRGGCKFRSDKTREIMSIRSKEFSNNINQVELRSTNAKHQHLQNKINKMKNVNINPLNLNNYIIERKSCVLVRIESSVVRFAGKHETQEQLRKRAVEFLNILATLPNCSGNPLEP